MSAGRSQRPFLEEEGELVEGGEEEEATAQAGVGSPLFMTGEPHAQPMNASASFSLLK